MTLRRGRALRRLLVAAIAAPAGLLLAPVATGAVGAVAITVAPASSLIDQSFSVRVSGLQPRQSAKLTLSATDANGIGWYSAASFVASRSGVIDTATSAASGSSYSGVEATGLLISLWPSDGGDEYFTWPTSGAQQFTLQVLIAGQAVATKEFERAQLGPGVAVSQETVPSNGFYGETWIPRTSRAHAAVVEFSGAEGGLDGQLLASALADEGIAVLDLAYFNAPGLPKELSAIPLSYFANAISWFAGQRGVDRKRIFVAGSSAGSQAALLLGVHYPSLVYGVIASTPYSAALCSEPSCSGPNWTYQNSPVAYTTFSDLEATDHPDAVIPVAQIHGPVLLDCGGVDPLAPCGLAETIMNELVKAHDRHTHELYSYPAAGHGVGGLAPFEPGTGTADVVGSTRLENALADAALWPHLIHFLRTSH